MAHKQEVLLALKNYYSQSKDTLMPLYEQALVLVKALSAQSSLEECNAARISLQHVKNVDDELDEVFFENNQEILMTVDLKQFNEMRFWDALNEELIDCFVNPELDISNTERCVTMIQPELSDAICGGYSKNSLIPAIQEQINFLVDAWEYDANVIIEQYKDEL